MKKLTKTKWVMGCVVTLLLSILAAWLYERHISNKRYFEFSDTSEFSIAMRQCYSVPENYTRFLIFPTTKIANIPIEDINLKGRLSSSIVIVDFNTTNKLHRAGKTKIYEPLHIFELRDRITNSVVQSVTASGISAFDIKTSEVTDVTLGFSESADRSNIKFAKNGLNVAANGKCSVVNILLLGDR